MQLPGPLRAAIGLAANVADEARRLPDRAIEVPMLAVSTALQMSLRAQQRYARLTARGDQILGGRPSDDPPPWATFDDPVAAEDLRSIARSQLGDSPDAARLLDELFGPDTGPPSEITPPTPITAAKNAPAKRKAAKRAPSPSKAGPAKSGAKDGDKLVKPQKKAGKSVSKPRHAAPSKFDDIGDD